MNHLRRRSLQASVVLVGVVVLALLAGAAGSHRSGSSHSETMGAQPDESGVFLPDALTNVPVPDGARAFSPAIEQGGAWVSSFEVTGFSPLEALQFYATSLPRGWTQTSATKALGGCRAAGSSGDGCTYKGIWNQNRLQLEVTAGPGGERADDEADLTQLNLVLRGAE